MFGSNNVNKRHLSHSLCTDRLLKTKKKNKKKEKEGQQPCSRQEVLVLFMLKCTFKVGGPKQQMLPALTLFLNYVLVFKWALNMNWSLFLIKKTVLKSPKSNLNKLVTCLSEENF